MMSLDSFFPENEEEDEFGDEDEDDGDDDDVADEALTCGFCDAPLIYMKEIHLVYRFEVITGSKPTLEMLYSCGNCKGHKTHMSAEKRLI